MRRSRGSCESRMLCTTGAEKGSEHMATAPLPGTPPGWVLGFLSPEQREHTVLLEVTMFVGYNLRQQPLCGVRGESQRLSTPQHGSGGPGPSGDPVSALCPIPVGDDSLKGHSAFLLQQSKELLETHPARKELPWR